MLTIYLAWIGLTKEDLNNNLKTGVLKIIKDGCQSDALVLNTVSKQDPTFNRDIYDETKIPKAKGLISLLKVQTVVTKSISLENCEPYISEYLGKAHCFIQDKVGLISS